MIPSHEERTFAALAHASILANISGPLGLLAAGLIWGTQRQRSHYVAAHALQALWYQAGVIFATIILALSWGGCVALSVLPMALRPDLYADGKLPGPFWLALATLIIPVIFVLLTALYGLFAAVQVYQGRRFHYPFMRRMFAKEYSPTVAAPAEPAAAESPPAELAAPTAVSEPIAEEAPEAAPAPQVASEEAAASRVE